MVLCWMCFSLKCETPNGFALSRCRLDLTRSTLRQMDPQMPWAERHRSDVRPSGALKAQDGQYDGGHHHANHCRHEQGLRFGHPVTEPEGGREFSSPLVGGVLSWGGTKGGGLEPRHVSLRRLEDVSTRWMELDGSWRSFRGQGSGAPSLGCHNFSRTL